jgi:antitoxin VapB
METAKLFWTGRSQAVRLPKEFRFDGQEVRIRRQGRSVILEPIADDWSWLDDIKAPLDSDVEEALQTRPAVQVRSSLDDLD